METVWDPERVKTVGTILSRYSEHLKPGNRVRRHIEGDPFSPAANDPSSASCGTVTQIARKDGSDRIDFEVTFDDGTTARLDNMSLDPERVWEIEPAFLDTFRGQIASYSNETEDRRDDMGDESAVRHDDHFKGVSGIVQRIDKNEAAQQEFQKQVLETVRHLASDMMRLSKGHEPEFVPMYADRYDLAIEEKNSAMRGASQGNARAHSNSRGARSGRDKRHDFELQDDLKDVQYADLADGGSVSESA